MPRLTETFLPSFRRIAHPSPTPSTCLRLAFLAAFASQAPAALAAPSLTNITWNSATTIAGDSDVDTVGSLVYAYNFGSITSATTTTINGVAFQPFVVTTGNQTETVGNVTVTENQGFLASDRDVGSNASPFSGLSTSYKSLLSSEVYADYTANIRVTLGGLTPGNSYRLQWWTNDAALTYLTSPISPRIFQSTISSGSATSVELDANMTDAVGGLGQYVIGTFTADGTTAAFALTGSGTGSSGNLFPMMNALQVRDASAAVPEIDPAGLGSVAALLTGALGLIERRRLRAKAS